MGKENLNEESILFMDWAFSVFGYGKHPLMYRVNFFPFQISIPSKISHKNLISSENKLSKSS